MNLLGEGKCPSTTSLDGWVHVKAHALAALARRPWPDATTLHIYPTNFLHMQSHDRLVGLSGLIGRHS